MRKIGSFLRDWWQLASPYFRSKEAPIALLLLAGAIGITLGAVGLEVIFNDWSRRFYDALEKKNEGIDALTTAAELEEMGELEAVGGKAYLVQLASAVPAAGNARHYAQLVKEQATLRSLLDVTRQIQTRVGERTGEPDQLVEDAERMLFEIAHSEHASDFRAIKEILEEEIDKLESDADRVMRAAMSKLFREEPDVREVIKLKAIYELLETITDKCEDVANLIEGIVLENS